MYLTNYNLFSGGLMYLPNFQGSFSERGQAKHTVLLSNISHIDHQASYTPDTLQYIEMMTPEPWIFSLYNLLNSYAIYPWLLEDKLVYDMNSYAFSLLSSLAYASSDSI